MNNRDKLNAMTDEELAELFCKTMEAIADDTKADDWCCDFCPARKICKSKHNGFLAWLRKEAE
jgi:hypothetical protein